VSRPKLPEVPKSKWKPRHHIGIYDYNYQVGESYYSPQTKYICTKRPIEATKIYEKPPESQTYAERFASNPIYGKTQGLPYAESESVFRQPVATHRVGTRGRGSSLTRDTGVSQYLSSLGSHDKFDRQESKLSRQFAEPNSQLSKPSLDDKSSKYGLEDSRRVTSLPPLKKRFDHDEYIPKQTFGNRINYPTKLPDFRTSSVNDLSKFRKVSFSDREPVSKPPPAVSLRSRRSSIGSPHVREPSPSLERRAKDEITNMTYGQISRDEGPRYRSSQFFREARRKSEAEDIGKMVDRLKQTGWGSTRTRVRL